MDSRKKQETIYVLPINPKVFCRLQHLNMAENFDRSRSIMDRNKYFMELALEQASQAFEAGEFPVGCVIVYDGMVVASGRRNNSNINVNELDHAEMVALRDLLSNSKRIDPGKVTVYSTMEPCLMCFSALLVNGVKKYVYSYEDVMGGGTNLPLNMLSPLYNEIEISVTGGVLRGKSLQLFKRFFSSPECKYLQDTLLANYTLQQ